MTATPSAETTKGQKRIREASNQRLDQALKTVVEELEPKTLRLPDALRSYHDALLKAHNTLAYPAAWDDDQTYVKAEQPAAICKVLIKALHPELVNANIAYVFRKKLSRNDRPRLAQASKVGGKLNYFTNLELLVEVNHETWLTLTPERRIALLDHELTHFSQAANESGFSYEMVEHDLEEFGSIVRRWGFWSTDVERFASSIEKARQLDIFSGPIEKAAAATTVN
jgi:hypothetical protein